MDAITYFLVNYGLYGLLLVVPAALLGIVFGWIAWGKHRAAAMESGRRVEEAERATQEVEIALSREREQLKMQQQAAREGGTMPPSADLDGKVAALRRDNEELEKILQAARREREDAEVAHFDRLEARAQELQRKQEARLHAEQEAALARLKEFALH